LIPKGKKKNFWNQVWRHEEGSCVDEGREHRRTKGLLLEIFAAAVYSQAKEAKRKENKQLWRG